LDDQAKNAIEKLKAFPIKDTYEKQDVGYLLETDFRTGMLIVRLFLGFSSDRMKLELKARLGNGGIGERRFKQDRGRSLASLESMGLPMAMHNAVHRDVAWHDIFVERLRSMRGKAIAGQRRGRLLEDFVEGLIQAVFG